ncbi:DNA repair protein XRCC1-like isoform X1 [Anneissia japonica]|uniref:DNA repair protein XRCC1-like isoform X1 n=1 Tax=Anneissia japonica TaxID=1529436 RepID=UPI001425527A|nr:DNA repair protein XRCC1-like isoform X1 [Anneissia japonica]
MPEIQFQHVISCSSEDETHKADNLLKTETYRKWKCATAGEKQATVILQFEKSSTINSLDIGNEGSAFVEVLVGKSSSDEDYQVLLVTSSFMSPGDSKNGTNTNRVRFFGPNQLTKTVINKSWDRVKVVCTQPFNKNITYGLSFIKLHSTPSPGEQSSDMGKDAKTQVNKLGHFKLKETNQPSMTIGSLFKSRNQEKPEPTILKGAAAVRAASSLAEQSIQASSHSKTADEQRIATLTQKQQTPSSKRKSTDQEKHTAEKHGPKQSPKNTEPSKRKTEPQQVPPMKKRKSDVAKSSPKKPFGKLMEGVVFVISGYQNPHRSDIRDKAIEMGARYKPDWGQGCTHLICAFANTPKYQSVRGKGKIVNKGWILDSYKKKMLLPWRQYKLASKDDSSSDETEDEDEQITSPEKKSTSKTETKRLEAAQDDEEDDEETMEASTSIMHASHVDESSGSDTEDEINRIQQNTGNDDDYGSSTDIDSDTENVSKQVKNTKVSRIDEADNDTGGNIPELPDFFTDKHFLLFGKFDELERRHLFRYITAFNGELEDYMSDNVSHIITKSQWDDNFDQALDENARLIFVRPKWIFSCGEKGKMVPYQPYVVVPSH